ncbi:hypothetical protein AKO1_010528 [Acrasis kona]|uniref:EGF-like domain-containing protein n=1 Tax=Acrasis kona TaxID=1008807 RepID=A0AAW2ZKX3_9EUKA
MYYGLPLLVLLCSISITTALTCNGISDTDPTVCNGRGLCTATDTCTCSNVAYFGQYCEQWSCAGIPSTSPSVCSTHGVCTPPIIKTYGPVGWGYGVTNFTDLQMTGVVDRFEVRTVTEQYNWVGGIRIGISSANYTGPMYPTTTTTYTTTFLSLSRLDTMSYLEYFRDINGIETTNLNSFKLVTAKNNLGYVVGSLYYGQSAVMHFSPNEYLMGIFGSYLPDGYSKHGITNLGFYTLTPGTGCVCDSNHTGYNCDVNNCFGVGSDSSSVCSGHGSCVDVNKCVCVADYYGANCDYSICNGTRSTDPSVCSGQGSCVAGACICNSDHWGPLCQLYKCNGIEYNRTNVCSSRGNCTALNTCVCNTNMYGSNCELTSCYGVASSNTSVCSGYGSCTDYNVCACTIGGLGSDCSIRACGGVAYNDPNVCSGHGYCPVGNVINTYGPYGSRRLTGSELKIDTGSTFYNTSINRIAGGSGVNLNGFWITNRKGDTSTIPDTGAYPSFYTFTPGEYLTQLRIMYYTGYDVVTGVKYTTSLGSTGMFGNDRGPNVRDINFGTGEYILGLFGYYGYATGGSYDTPGMTTIGITALKPGTGCVCTDGYTGINCDTVNCYGKYNYEATVCSAHGTCIYNNNCSCSTGYYGSECQYWNCNGLPSTNSSSCGTFGTCVSPNNCQCTFSVSGGRCDMFQCFGKNNTDPTACSSHGSCIAPGTCSCQSGYSGFDCGSYSCYGVPSGFGGCSGNGVCVSPDNCSCLTGYYGSTCDNWKCNGIEKSNTSSCTANGLCLSPGSCTCLNGYTGPQCKSFSCAGVSPSDPTVCSSKGNCTAPETCQCQSGYFNTYCQDYNCFGKLHTSSFVCGQHGTCSSPDNCVCGSGRSGDECDIYQCWGKNHTDPTVCSGRGKCTNPNACACRNGASDANCETFYCNGLSRLDTNVCSAHGNCVYSTGIAKTPLVGIYDSNTVFFEDVDPVNPVDVLNIYAGLWMDSVQFQRTSVNYSSPLYMPAGGTPTYYKLPTDAFFTSFVIFFDGNHITGVFASVSNGVNYMAGNANSATSYVFDVNEKPMGFYGGFDGGVRCLGLFVNRGFGGLCNCSNHYYGTSCDVVDCYGIPSNSTGAVCSGNGTCTGYNTCTCNSGYAGSDCSTYACNGFIKYDNLLMEHVWDRIIVSATVAILVVLVSIQSAMECHLTIHLFVVDMEVA